MQTQGVYGDTRDERSLGDLFGELLRELSTLVRQEVALASAELSGKASKVGRELGFLAVGAAVTYAGFLAIVAAAALFLALFLPLWLAALIVGAVVAGVGYALVQKGLGALKRVDLTPRRTVDSLREDVEWAKEQVQ